MQAKHFLNAFWSRQAGGIPDEGFEKHQEKAEEIWNYTAEFIKLDKRKKDAGNELDEFEAHQLLEHEVGAMTVKDMRAALQAIDIDFNRMMSMTEFLIFHYKLDIADVEFLVNWWQYTSDYNSWEPDSSIMDIAEEDKPRNSRRYVHHGRGVPDYASFSA